MYPHPNMQPQPSPPKRSRGMLWLIIGTIVFAVVSFVGIGAFTFVKMSRTFKEIGAPSDAGPPMKPEEIRALLEGPKKDYVGEWEHPTGRLVIKPDGRAAYGMKVGFGSESANGKIEVWNDDAFYIAGFRFPIEEPPHRVGNRWKMKVRGYNFERD